jgi:hypothetical protein
MTAILTTDRAEAALRDFERRRASLLAAVAACPRHTWTQVGPDRAFAGPVAPRGKENQAAHGNIEITVRCQCGAERHELVNGLHVEVGVAYAPMSEIDEALSSARRELDRQRALDATEAAAWRTIGAGREILAVPGAQPVEVQIVPYRDCDYVRLSIDGAEACYSLAQLEATGTASHLDDAQRTTWALIARRAARLLREARS